MDGITGTLIFYVALLFIMMVPGIIMKLCSLSPNEFGKGISNKELMLDNNFVEVYDCGQAKFEYYKR